MSHDNTALKAQFEDKYSAQDTPVDQDPEGQKAISSCVVTGSC